MGAKQLKVKDTNKTFRQKKCAVSRIRLEYKGCQSRESRQSSLIVEPKEGDAKHIKERADFNRKDLPIQTGESIKKS